MKRRWPLAVIALLLVTNGVTAAMAGWYAFESWAWRAQMHGQAAHAGEIQAIEDYRVDHKRLLQPVGSGGVEFTGRVDDQLEVWTWPAMTAHGRPYEYTKTYVWAYNNRMRLMVEFPDTIKANYDHLADAGRSVAPPE